MVFGTAAVIGALRLAPSIVDGWNCTDDVFVPFTSTSVDGGTAVSSINEAAAAIGVLKSAPSSIIDGGSCTADVFVATASMDGGTIGCNIGDALVLVLIAAASVNGGTIGCSISEEFVLMAAAIGA